MAAAGGVFFGVLATESNAAVTVLRIDQRGTVLRRRLFDPLAYYFSHVATQGLALFIGTSVIKRFTNATDELLRLDGSTLTVTARISLPGAIVAIACDRNGLWVALSDRIMRLDPNSLAPTAIYRILGALPPPLGSSSISSLARGLGGLWATFGDSRRTWLYNFDPVTLAIRARIDVLESAQGIRVVAGTESTWLTGEDFVRRVAPSGRLSPPFLTAGLQAAAARGRGLLALFYSGNAADRLVELNQRGAAVASSQVGDADARITVDGRTVWLLHGLGLARWMLINAGPGERPPAAVRQAIPSKQKSSGN
jgi:hypothetical protein